MSGNLFVPFTTLSLSLSLSLSVMVEGVACEVPEDKFCEAVQFAYEKVYMYTPLTLHFGVAQCKIHMFCVLCVVCVCVCAGPATTSYSEAIKK